MKLGIDVRWLHEAHINAASKDRYPEELNVPSPSGADSSGGLGGVGRYLYELLPRLASILNEAEAVLFFLEGTEPPGEILKLWPEAEGAFLSRNWRPKGGSFGPLWRLTRCFQGRAENASVRRFGLDVFFSPHQLVVPGRLWAEKRIVTCHDLAYLEYPELFFKDGEFPGSYAALYQALSNCEKILAVSAATASSLQNNLEVPAERIIVTPEGVALLFREEGIPFSPGWPYFLFLGGVGPGKNLKGTLLGWKLARTMDVDSHLVLVGVKRDSIADLLGTLRSNDAECVHCIEAPDDYQLRALYIGAVALLMPSIVEGFGLPVIESMACGCPVITSTNSPMEGITGDAAILVDPYDSSQIAEAVVKIMHDGELRATMSDKGRNIAEGYTWERTASLTADAIRELVSREQGTP